MTPPGRRAAQRYTAFGLRIVATGPLPGLSASGGAGVPDVLVRLQETPAWPRGPAADDAGELLYRSADRDDGGRPTLTVARLRGGRLFRLSYAEGVQFVVCGAGREVWATWPDPWTADDMATYLLGPVFAFILRLRGVTCLHASAIAVEGRAVVFVGPAGAGKSTVAATFARRGYAVMSDDVVALHDDGGAPSVQPGPSRIRLWPESVLALYGSAEALPRLTPTWDKRFLDAASDGHRFQERPLPLSAIYVLGERGSHPTAPRVEPLSPAAALIALVTNTQASHLADEGIRARDFRRLGRVATSVRVCRAIPHEDVARLPALCDAVVADVVGAAAHV